MARASVSAALWAFAVGVVFLILEFAILTRAAPEGGVAMDIGLFLRTPLLWTLMTIAFVGGWIWSWRAKQRPQP